MNEPPGGAVDDETLRLAGLGAFAHEMRTPLTAMRMLIDLARTADGDGLELDGELAEMLVQSLDDLTRLADALQDLSRLDRGKDTMEPGPCGLREAVTAAAAMTGQAVKLTAEQLPEVAGPWDPRRLPRAIAGLARGANHAGDGGGIVRLSGRLAPTTVELAFQNGAPASEARQPEADAGFAFFQGAGYIRAMGGMVTYRRARGGCCIEASLPLERPPAS